MVISKLKIGTYLLLIAVGIGIGYLLFANKTTTITIPAKEGKIKEGKTVYVTDTLKVYVTKWKTKTETVEIKTKNPVNDSLALAYQQTKDSLDRYKLYLDAISLRDFKSEFEDDNLKLTMKGSVQGYLKDLEVSNYTIKPVEVEVPLKRFGLSLYAGYGLSSDLTLKPQIGLGFSYSIWEF